MPAYCAINTNYGQRDRFVFQLDVSFIGTIADQTSGMSAGTRNKVQIERIYRFIIKILRNKVVVFCFDCYHKNEHGSNAMLWI